ncbi:hypothetical protein TEA_019372 [Camellia sinensis var. sinensis]|uniref:GOLD domain-containing protein n=1 Tax=Camellia sinensis var. sinensis TaxID=542762 RepID=A0A4S4EGC9_CAMSN|nr:hypothetical protein TEA_019372 [Camellia sinensis var. sinensis]
MDVGETPHKGGRGWKAQASKLWESKIRKGKSKRGVEGGVRRPEAAGNPSPTAGSLTVGNPRRRKVTSPFGNNLHRQENVTHGQFAFTAKEAGNYGACFWVDGNHQGGQDVPVSLEWRIGVDAKDWETVARKEKIEGVELELMKLEGAVQAIHQNLIYLKDREAEMREVSERTNSRVAWFSIMSLGVCIVVSGLQLWHLKSFFRKKKLI